MNKSIEETLASIGEKLIYLRKQKGYSSHETFAFDFNLPRVQYWRLERGKANFTLKTLMEVLAIHGLTIEAFFQLTPPPDVIEPLRKKRSKKVPPQ